jgi:hypothetical protein
MEWTRRPSEKNGIDRPSDVSGFDTRLTRQDRRQDKEEGDGANDLSDSIDLGCVGVGITVG